MTKYAVYAVLIGAALALGAAAFGRAPAGAEERWMPQPGTTWQWQLSDPPSGDLADVDAYDLDGFETSAATVERIHANGSGAICYINVGAWENWRPDKNRFPKRVIGNDYEGWAGEKWLDIRRLGALGPIMGARMDMCERKGFDAIEPDNMDSYADKTGFKLTWSDQIRYNRWLANAAHERGLSIAMKNDQAQIFPLVDHFDFAITEDCFDERWCNEMSPFIDQNKAVLAAEYTDTGARLNEFCPRASVLKFDAILKKRYLGPWRRSC